MGAETGAVHGAGLPHLATFSAPDSALHRWPKTLSLRNVTAEVINAFFWDAAVAGARATQERWGDKLHMYALYTYM